MKKLVALTLCLPAIATAADLVPFTSDGCSAFPNGTSQNQTLWLECCIKHDLAYWMGGTEPQRLSADLALEQCVATTGEHDIAKLMLQGVRAGGSPSLRTPFRWGYGWPFGRGYQALSKEELAQVREQLKSMQSLVQSALAELAADDK